MLYRSAHQFFTRFGFALLCILFLGACQFSPAYQSHNVDENSAFASTLSNLQIKDVNNRIDQIIRNELMFKFSATNTSAEGNPNLTIASSVGTENLIIQQISGLPQSKRITLTTVIRYTGEPSDFSDTLKATASFNTNDQQFSNLRAEKDAEQRVAKMMAGFIEARLISHLSSQ